MKSTEKRSERLDVIPLDWTRAYLWVTPLIYEALSWAKNIGHRDDAREHVITILEEAKGRCNEFAAPRLQRIAEIEESPYSEEETEVALQDLQARMEAEAAKRAASADPGLCVDPPLTTGQLIKKYTKHPGDCGAYCRWCGNGMLELDDAISELMKEHPELHPSEKAFQKLLIERMDQRDMQQEKQNKFQAGLVQKIFPEVSETVDAETTDWLERNMATPPADDTASCREEDEDKDDPGKCEL